MMSLLERERVRNEVQAAPPNAEDAERLGIPDGLYELSARVIVVSAVRGAVLGDIAMMLSVDEPGLYLAQKLHNLALDSESHSDTAIRDAYEMEYLLGEPRVDGKDPNVLWSRFEALTKGGPEATKQRLRDMVHRDFPDFEHLMPHPIVVEHAGFPSILFLLVLIWPIFFGMKKNMNNVRTRVTRRFSRGGLYSAMTKLLAILSLSRIAMGQTSSPSVEQVLINDVAHLMADQVDSNRLNDFQLIQNDLGNIIQTNTTISAAGAQTVEQNLGNF